MIDAHCHIDLYKNPLQVVKECERSGITTIAMTNLPSHFELGHPHLRSCRYVRLALGMHPLHAELHQQEMPVFIKNLPNTSYIGEIGLDFSREGIATKGIQENTFKTILNRISGDKKLLSLHSRRAEKEVLLYLRQFHIKSAIFHWYSGPLALIDEIVANGYYFSINPAMTKSQNGQKIINRIPKSNLLTETDGPFVDINGSQATPYDVRIVIEYLSKQLNIPFVEVETLISDNFKKLISSLKQ